MCCGRQWKMASVLGPLPPNTRSGWNFRISEFSQSYCDHKKEDSLSIFQTNKPISFSKFLLCRIVTILVCHRGWSCTRWFGCSTNNAFWNHSHGQVCIITSQQVSLQLLKQLRWTPILWSCWVRSGLHQFCKRAQLSLLWWHSRVTLLSNNLPEIHVLWSKWFRNLSGEFLCLFKQDWFQNSIIPLPSVAFGRCCVKVWISLPQAVDVTYFVRSPLSIPPPQPGLELSYVSASAPKIIIDFHGNFWKLYLRHFGAFYKTVPWMFVKVHIRLKVLVVLVPLLMLSNFVSQWFFFKVCA